VTERLHNKDYTVAEAVQVVHTVRDHPALSGFLTRRDLLRAAGVLADYAAATGNGPINVAPGRAVITMPDGTSYEIPLVGRVAR
jgi:hypothetical protein